MMDKHYSMLGRKVSCGWVCILIGAVTLSTVLYVSSWSSTRVQWGAVGSFRPVSTGEHRTEDVDSSDAECLDMPGADEVMVVLRTGATEMYDKLPIHLMTTLKCIPNYVVVADLEAKVGDIAVHDAIASVSQQTRDKYGDFDLYRDIQQWYHKGQDMRKLPSDHAWTLDKWKFMPTIHHAWEVAPSHTKWFVVMEADTILSWVNLLSWLGGQDASKAWYFGSPAPYLPVEGFYFAHGGSGVVISRPALERLEHARATEAGGPEAYDLRWEVATDDNCCGDVIVGQALEEVGVKITSETPRFHGESPKTVVWDHHNWCVPPITWHHVEAMEVDRVWQFEQAWIRRHGRRHPYFFHHVFEELIEPHVSVNQSRWNNMKSKYARVQAYSTSSDRYGELAQYEQDAAHSQEACAAACRRKPSDECVQWKWTPGSCHLGGTFIFGSTDQPENEHWESGWLLDRLRASVGTCGR